MKSFSEWSATQATPARRKWKASKDQIIQFWRSLRSDMPIQLTPISYEHKGSTYAEDGVRITGSKEFIASVLSRLKEFLNFEGPQAKLQLVFRETESPSSPEPGKVSYVFYVQSRQRGLSPKQVLGK